MLSSLPVRRITLIGVCLLLILCAGDRGPALLRLAFLGDVMFGRGVAKAHVKDGWTHTLDALPKQLTRTD